MHADMRLGMLLGQTGVLAVAAVVDQASGHPNFSSYLRGPGSRIRCFCLKKVHRENPENQCSGYVTCWYGSGSSNPYI